MAKAGTTSCQLLLGREVYDLRLATPGEFLLEPRARGVL